MKKNERELQLWERAKCLVFEGGDDTMTVEEANVFIEKAISLDIGRYMLNLSRQSDMAAFPFIELSELVDVVRSSFKNADESHRGENVKEDFDTMLESALQGNEEGFIDTIKGVIGKTKPEEEIRRGCDLFLEKTTVGQDNLHRLTAQKIAPLYRQWCQDPQGVTLNAWLLSYVLDKEDLIYENLPLIGYLDDLFVLECAETLIAARQTGE